MGWFDDDDAPVPAPAPPGMEPTPEGAPVAPAPPGMLPGTPRMELGQGELGAPLEPAPLGLGQGDPNAPLSSDDMQPADGTQSEQVLGAFARQTQDPQWGWRTEVDPETGEKYQVPITSGEHAQMAGDHVWDQSTEQWISYNPSAPPAPKQKKGRGRPGGSLSITTTTSPNMGRLADATQAQAEAIRALADLEANQADETADLYDEMANTFEQEVANLRATREQAMGHAVESSRMLQAQADELGATEPQVGRLFGTGNQAAAMGAALSIAAGAMLSVRRGGPNVALGIVNKAIERDLAAQKQAIQNKQFALRSGMQIAQQMQAAYRNDITAQKAVQATLEKYALNRLNTIIGEHAPGILRAQAESGIADLQLKYEATLEEVTRENYSLRIAGPVRKLQNMLAAAQKQTLPPPTTPDNAGNGDAAIAGTEAQIKVDRDKATQKRAEGARQRQAGRKVVKDAEWKPSEYPGFFVSTAPDGTKQYMPDQRSGQYARSVKLGPMGGFQVPAELVDSYQAPEGWIAIPDRRTGGMLYAPRAAFGQADPARREKARKQQAAFIELPQDVNVPANAWRGKRGGQAGMFIDPGKFGTPEAMQAARNKASAFEKDFRSFQIVYNEAKRLARDDKSFWDVNRQAGQALQSRLAAIVTRLNDGGVMGEAEYDRAASQFTNPQEWRNLKEGIGTIWGTPEEKNLMAGWDQLNTIFKKERQAQYDRLAGGGRSLEYGGRSEDVNSGRRKTAPDSE